MGARDLAKFSFLMALRSVIVISLTLCRTALMLANWNSFVGFGVSSWIME